MKHAHRASFSLPVVAVQAPLDRSDFTLCYAQLDEMIDVQSLTKHFGPIKAVNGITFSVNKGDVLGFLGPNGAGKSTTMKMITGFLAPTSGTVSVCGHDIEREPIAAKREIGYLPEGAPLYADMTPIAFLRFIAASRGLSGAERKRAIDRVVGLAQLEQVVNQPIETLSKGFKRRVGLAQALLHDPQVLVLDEPTDGLDPNQKSQVRKIIHDMASEKAIIISTHILEEVDAVCTRALMIAGGVVKAEGTPAELQARSARHNAVRMLFADGQVPAGAREALLQLPSVRGVEDNEAGIVALPKGGQSIIGTVGDLARDKKWKVAEITVEQGHLDEVFRMVTAPGGVDRTGVAA